MNDTSKMDKLFEKYIVLGGFQKRVEGALFKFQNTFADVVEVFKIAKALKSMVLNKSLVVPHHRGILVKMGPKKTNAISLAHHTNTQSKP